MRAAFAPVWIETESLTLQVSDTAFIWFGVPVHVQEEKAGDSLPWTLYKDGLRELTITPGFEDEQKQRSESKEAAKRTYAQSVAATKDVMNSVRMGQNPNLKKVKRVVQGIVDQILADEASLVGLATIRDYALPGVDVISVGALTHSARAVDLSLEVVE